MEVLDEVRAIIAKSLNIPIERLTPDARLDELGAESLDVIEIVFSLEEKFDIAIPFKADEGTRVTKSDSAAGEGDMEFSTIGDIARVVQDLIKAKASS